MRVLLLGANGMLGRAVHGSVPGDVDLVPRSRAELDITDSDALRRTVPAISPDVIINCAAYTAVDAAESDPHTAFAVNAAAVAVLAAVAAESKAKLVHFSSDYIFDGLARAPYKEDATPNPLSVYGASKLAGEHVIRASRVEHLIVRTQWLFGDEGRSFPRTMFERATARTPTKVVADQTGRPTYAGDLARAVWQLLGCGATGVLHVANEGSATWFDVAREIFSRVGVPDLLRPCSSEDWVTPAKRPLYSVLDTDSQREVLGTALLNWRVPLGRLVDELLGAST